MVNLGDKVRDLVTGFEGVAVAKTTWLSGCERFTIQPGGVTAEGKTHDTETFDVTQLEVVEAGAVQIARTDTGGPRPEPVRRADVG